MWLSGYSMVNGVVYLFIYVCRVEWYDYNVYFLIYGLIDCFYYGCVVIELFVGGDFCDVYFNVEGCFESKLCYMCVVVYYIFFVFWRCDEWLNCVDWIFFLILKVRSFFWIFDVI